MSDKFELPSGLPEGPWEIDPEKPYLVVVPSDYSRMIASANTKEIARAIASIPAMVEEIGRLRALNAELEELAADRLDSMGQRQTRLAEQAAEIAELESAAEDNCGLIARLRALNAEMREALRDLVTATEAEVNEKGGSGFLLARLTDARAILAKSQEAAS